TRRSDAGGADHAFSRSRRALALRAYPLVEILPMTRSHRSVHRALWPVLALAVALGFAMALTLRPPPNVEAPAAAGEVRPSVPHFAPCSGPGRSSFTTASCSQAWRSTSAPI